MFHRSLYHAVERIRGKPNVLYNERESAVGVELVPEDPFARNDIGVGWARNELPSVIGEEGVKLITHGLGPVGFEKS